MHTLRHGKPKPIFVLGFLFVFVEGFELGASKLKFAYSPIGEKTVQWTVLREAREKQIPLSPPRIRTPKGVLFSWRKEKGGFGRSPS